MANIRATEVRKGMVLVMDGELFEVTRYDHVTPGKGRAHNQLTIRSLKTGNTKPLRLGSGETVETAYLDKRPCQFLYQDKDGAHFMDTESYEQFALPMEKAGSHLPFLTEEVPVNITFHEGQPINVALPAAVVLEVTEAEEAVRGDTATNVTKNATLQTGHQLKVPNHIREGDKVKVSTETGEFLGRSNE